MMVLLKITNLYMNEKEIKIPIEINEHMLSIFLKELVRRAIKEIRNQRHSFESTQKDDYDGVSMEDVFTTADTNAQALYEKSITEALPGFGIIGEEGLRKECTLGGCEAYITIDPLDGTKAFIRRQSHGVSTMLGCVIDGQVVSAWIGDINTQEVYGYRPCTGAVHRITEFETAERLDKIERDIPAQELFLLRRSFLPGFSKLEEETHKLFGEVQVDGASIGTWFSRMWKGEIGALIVDASYETPWDMTPVVGISERLGFQFFKPVDSGENIWEKYTPLISKDVYKRDFPLLVLHSAVIKHLPEGFCIS